MAKKEETKEVKEPKKEAPKKEAPKQEAVQEAKKEKKQDKRHEGKGEGKEHEKKDRKGAPKEGKKEIPKARETGPEIKHFVRIANTDLDGKKSVQYGLIGIKGIGRRAAKILTVNSAVDPKATLGYVSDVETERLQLSVDNISSILPAWMVNKQNDIMSGEDKHLIGTDVLLGLNEDLNTMKKMRSYKGLRHERGLRVRGQRSRSTGRRGRTVGVSRATLQAKPKEAEKKEEKKGAGK